MSYRIEFFSGKYSEAEKEVEELREELTALKSKGAMIK